MEQYLRIGKIVATFGLQGELVLVHELGKKSDLKGLDALFIELRPGDMLPYFPEQAKARTPEETLLKLEGINTPESAKPLIRKNVWLREADARRLTAASAPLSLLGFTVVEGKRIVGEVLEVIEQPMQVLLRVDRKGHEAYIPLHEETLLKIDRKARKIHVKLPDGLLDVYAGEA
jgi:16S rRNA processing protein RimM